MCVCAVLAPTAWKPSTLFYAHLAVSSSSIASQATRLPPWPAWLLGRASSVSRQSCAVLCVCDHSGNRAMHMIHTRTQFGYCSSSAFCAKHQSTLGHTSKSRLECLQHAAVAVHKDTGSECVQCWRQPPENPPSTSFHAPSAADPSSIASQATRLPPWPACLPGSASRALRQSGAYFGKWPSSAGPRACC